MRRAFTVLLCVATFGCSEDSANTRCTPGFAACLGKEVHRCNSEGSAFVPERVCGAGEKCFAGDCVVDNCGNGVCDADEDCSSCSEDCGACPKPHPQPTGDGGVDAGPPPTGPCPPQKPLVGFCDVNKAMKCDSTGTKSTMQWDCDALNFPGVTFTCVECKDKAYATCDNDKAVWTSGTLTGPVSMTYSARMVLHSGCDYDPFYNVYTWFENGTFRHHANHSPAGGGGSDVRVDIPAPVSGQPVPLYSTSVPHLCTLRLTDDAVPDDKWYSYANLNPPPDVGSVTLTYSGTSKGDTWSLGIAGYVKLWDAKGESSTWKPVSYKASGIVTGKSWP